MSFQVGDGLEMFVVLAPGRGADELQTLTAAGVGVREVTPADTQRERIFVVYRELKRD